MPRTINKLTERDVRRLAESGERGYYADGDNLYLAVRLMGERRLCNWAHRFTSPVVGKRREFGLGSLRDYSLTQARKRNREVRQLVQSGVDPIEDKKARRVAAIAEAAAKITVRQEV